VLKAILVCLPLLACACDTIPGPETEAEGSPRPAPHDSWTPSFVHADAEDGAVVISWGVPASVLIAGARVQWALGNSALPWPGEIIVVDETHVRIPVPMNGVTLFASVALFDANGVEHPASAIVSATPAREIGSLIPIPAGAFTMGWEGGLEDADESPAHAVWLSAYSIERYPATVAQHAECVAMDACAPPAEWGGWIAETGWVEDLRDTAGVHPAVGLTHAEAMALCAYRGLRLPTEAEWERAARGAEDTYVFPWGGETPDCALASFTDSEGNACEQGTREVGSRPDAQGPLGLHDTAGGAWEWVSDWYAADAYANPVFENPTGPPDGEAHVLRSGAWNALPNALYLTARRPGPAALERAASPEESYSAIGVRCARSQN